MRLEAAMRLYGNDIDETTSVLEAGLGWTIAWNRAISLAAVVCSSREAWNQPQARRLEMLERAIARHGYPVLSGGRQVGVVTSGTQTPFLKKAIGMAYVPTSCTRPAARSTSTCAAVSQRLASSRCVLLSDRGLTPGLTPEELRCLSS